MKIYSMLDGDGEREREGGGKGGRMVRGKEEG